VIRVAGVARGVRLAVVLVIFAGSLFFPAFPAAAVCLPGVSSGKDAPTPVMPDAGLTGGILPAPEHPVDADPFAKDPQVSIAQVYGLGWARWDTYDLGCGGAVRNPQASTDTGVGSFLLSVPTVVSALTASLAHYAYTPEGWLGTLDPALIGVATGLTRAITDPLAPLALIIAGAGLIWASRRMKFAAAATTTLGVLAAITVLFVAANAPVQVGHAADTVMATGAGSLNTHINGRGDSAIADPGTEAVAPYIDHVLYPHWLAGQLGSATSSTATRYGPALLRASAVSWVEANRVRSDPDATRTLFEAKQQAWTDTAERIKAEDPDAYAYLTGARTNRTVEALWVLAGAFTLVFPIVAFLLMMAGYLVVRFVVMTAPAWATIAIIPALHGTLRSALGVIAAAIINPIIMAVGSSISVLITGFLLAPGTGLGWLGLPLAMLFSALMWIVLKPYRRLTSLATNNPINDATGGLAAIRSRAAGFARTAATTAVGVTAAEHLTDHNDDPGDKEAAPDGTTTTRVGVPADSYRRPAPEPTHHSDNEPAHTPTGFGSAATNETAGPRSSPPVRDAGSTPPSPTRSPRETLNLPFREPTTSPATLTTSPSHGHLIWTPDRGLHLDEPDLTPRPDHTHREYAGVGVSGGTAMVGKL
jgi:hypothetical protein